MKLFGSLSEVVSLVFRKNSQQITLRPNQTTSYTASRDIQTPQQDAASILVSRDSTDTLTNKSISGSTNTLTNIPAGTAITGQLPTANGGTGQNSTATFPTSGVVVTEAATETLTNKTISGSSNTLTVLAGSQLSGQVPTANGGTGQNSTATFPTSGVVVTEAASETLTNKTINGASNTLTVRAASDITGQLPLTNGGTAFNASSAANLFDHLSPLTTKGDLIAYSTTNARLPVGTDAQVLVADSTQTLGLKWANASSGGGSKNYISSLITTSGTNNGNGDFELGTTTGWSLAHSTLTSLAPTTVATATNSFSSAGGVHGGSAASGNLSFSAINSSQLARSWSGSLVSSAASTAGDMLISDTLFIDTEDQAKSLNFSFAYKAVSGTFNFSGTSSNTHAIYIYDITNAAWIQPAGVYNLVQSSGVGKATGSFQTTSNSTAYQIALININATGGAYSLTVDDFSLGPVFLPTGAALGDEINLDTIVTPNATRFGTVASQKYWYRRVGDMMEIRGEFVCGTTGGSDATDAYVSLVGFSLDTARMVSGSLRTVVGSHWVLDNSGANFGSDNRAGTMYVDSANSSKIWFAKSTTTNVLVGGVAVATSSAVTFRVTVPIAGWSANSVMSADTDTRLVDFYASGTSQAVTADTTNITLTSTRDTHGAWNGTTTYSVPISGDYMLFGRQSSSAVSSIKVWIGGVVNKTISTTNVVNVSTTMSGLIFGLKAGDALTLRSDSSVTVNSIEFSLVRVSGPAVVAASENVAAKYKCTTGPALSTNDHVNYDTKIYDTHNAVTTGTGTSWVFTVPVSGYYLVTVGMRNPGTTATIVLGKTGATESQLFIIGTASDRRTGSSVVQAVAGDTLYAFTDTGTTMTTDATTNQITITKMSR